MSKNAGFQLLFADTSLLIVSKSCKLLSVPGRGEDKQDCLITRVQAQYPDALIVHRLDFDTSGLMVLARGKATHRALSIAFAAREVDKRYRAIVAGRLGATQGTVNLPLLVDWPNRPLHKVNFTDGKAAITHYQLLGYDVTQNASEVSLIPETGRTHQLRVHMHALGHPILGDPLYAPSSVLSQAKRLLLHAEYLAFTHPDSGERLTFTEAAGFSLSLAATIE